MPLHCIVRNLAALSVAWCVGASAVLAEVGAGTTTLTLAGEAQQQQWTQALVLLSTGQLDEATEVVHGLAAGGVQDERLLKVDAWLDAFAKVEKEREELRRQDYEQYVAWVREDVEQGKWRRAMINCARAFHSCEDREAFRKQEWVQKVVSGALELAAECERDGKWPRAAGVYLTLQDLFPDEVAYRTAFERTQDHLRLEYTYTEETDWETDVSDITPLMAAEAFKRMHESYLREPSFKERVLAALRHMLLLTEQPALAKVFEKLGSPDEVEEFRERITPWLERAERRSEMSRDDLIETFDRVVRINREIQLLPQNVLIREFVQGALKPLDKFSDMLWPAETEEFNKHTQGRFPGVGISIQKDRNAPILVISPLEDTPAYHAGIRPGDLITRINGKPAEPLTITRAVREITGPPGTYVTLTVKRPDVEAEFDLRLQRAEITIYTIKGYRRNEQGQWDYMIDPERRIAYLRMTNFMEETANELEDTIRSLREGPGGLNGLILDLRGNPGGLLKAAVDVSNLLLGGEKEIVSTRDRSSESIRMSTTEPEGEHYPDIPLVLLVNESSASASEIVAGALQVHGRALLVGERTYGKGSVQQVLHVTPDRRAFVKLTTALYYLPNGRCLHREEDSTTWGVDPDVAVKLVPKEMIKVAKMRRQSDILKGLDQEELTDADFEKVFSTTRPAGKAPTDGERETGEAAPLEDDGDGGPEEELAEGEEDDDPREDPNNWPERDPQLEVAQLLLRIRLETNHPWPVHAAEVAVGSGGKPVGSRQ